MEYRVDAIERREDERKTQGDRLIVLEQKLGFISEAVAAIARKLDNLNPGGAAMSAPQKFLAAIVAAAIVALLVLAYLAFYARTAQAHSWYTGSSNLGDNQLIDPRDYQDVRVREWLGGMFY